MLGLRYILFITETKATELSEVIGVSNQFINDWVKGRKPIPDKHLHKLSDFFEIDESYFKRDLTFKDKMEIDLKLNIFENDLNEKEARLLRNLIND